MHIFIGRSSANSYFGLFGGFTLLPTIFSHIIIGKAGPLWLNSSLYFRSNIGSKFVYEPAVGRACGQTGT